MKHIELLETEKQEKKEKLTTITRSMKFRWLTLINKEISKFKKKI